MIQAGPLISTGAGKKTVMVADTVVRASIDAAQRIAEGRPWASAWALCLQEAFDADALCSIVSWTHAEGVAMPTQRVEICAVPAASRPAVGLAVGASHPSLLLLRNPALPSAHRLSDHLAMRDYWHSNAYLSLHDPLGGRYPAALRLCASPTRTVFAGLVRRSRDFTIAEVRELGRLEEPIASALAYRDALSRASIGCASDITLTLREQQVLARVSEGWTDERIGHALSISERTVRKHLVSARAKVGAGCRSDAAAWWARHGDG